MKSKIILLLLTLLAIPFSFASTLDELLPNEKNTVEIFQNFSPKVVYVHRLKNVIERYSLRKHVAAGAGSGIIWDNKGHIVTNFHVVKGADELAISIGKLTIPAKVIGTEPRKDLAVLQITDKSGLTLLSNFVPFKLASTHSLLVGEKAIAIGNPFGLDHTLTVGVVSALGRNVPGVGGVTIHEMIQTDASINPGNSGGPLLDSKGRLLGLNTAIYSSSGASAGIGFAVPADDIARIVPQLIKNGRVILAGLGIRRVENGVAQRLGVKKGVLVGDVLPHTPAAKARMQGTYRNRMGRMVIGDIIVAINDLPVANYDELYNYLSSIKVGSVVTVTINRNNKFSQLKIKTMDISSY